MSNLLPRVPSTLRSKTFVLNYKKPGDLSWIAGFFMQLNFAEI
jgi:hypothetical protein